MLERLQRGVWLLAGAKAAVLLATTRLGFHRDELYFIAASKRLSWSYVDFQPVVPLLVRLERALFGDSLLGLRVIPAIAAGAAVVLAAIIVRELGGGRKAQLLAALALGVVPLFVGMGGSLNTVVIETPAWMLVALVVARLARTDDPRWWVALGAAVAAALLVKFTVLALLAGLAVALLLSPLRRHVRTPWPWLGGAVVAAAVAPVLVWQAAHDWAVVEFVSHQGTGGRVLGLSGRLGFLVSLVALPGPVALWLWLPGIRHLWRDRRFRVLATTHVAALVILFAASGKGYYAAPAIAVLLSAGSVARALRAPWPPRALVIASLVTLALGLPLFVAPVSWLRASEDLSDATELGERIGWEDIAITVDRVLDDLPPEERSRAVVLGRNYSLAAAIEFYAGDYGLPPAGSGHNSAFLWRPRAAPDRVAIAIGFEGAELRRLYTSVERVGTIRNREGVHNYEWGDPVHVARGPKLGWHEEWRRLKVFTA